MKRFLGGLLTLLLGAAGGFYLGSTQPTALTDLKNNIPFIGGGADSTQVEEQPLDSIASDSVTLADDCMELPGLRDKLVSVSESLEAMNLQYIQSKGQDCSGIYHKIKDSVQGWMPENCEMEYVYPEFDQIRSSRQIADWYHANGNLTLVEDPMAERNRIRPGAVMFYSKPGQRYSGLTIQKLTDRDNNYSSNGAIMHIATVVDVVKDAEGNVTEYTIMHGRNPRHKASRTTSKEVQSTNTPNLPKFGNWNQQWVAIADIVTVKSTTGS